MNSDNDTLPSSTVPRNDEAAADATVISRRTAIKTALAGAGAAALGGQTMIAADQSQPDPRRASTKRYEMKNPSICGRFLIRNR